MKKKKQMQEYSETAKLLQERKKRYGLKADASLQDLNNAVLTEYYENKVLFYNERTNEYALLNAGDYDVHANNGFSLAIPGFGLTPFGITHSYFFRTQAQIKHYNEIITLMEALRPVNFWEKYIKIREIIRMLFDLVDLFRKVPQVENLTSPIGSRNTLQLPGQ